jgi:hypothetical protein
MNVIELKPSNKEVEIYSLDLKKSRYPDYYDIFINDILCGAMEKSDIKHFIGLLDFFDTNTPELSLNGVKVGYIDSEKVKSYVKLMDNVIHH